MDRGEDGRARRGAAAQMVHKTGVRAIGVFEIGVFGFFRERIGVEPLEQLEVHAEAAERELRQGSGFKKITETYRAAHNYRDELEPKFYSDASSFQVTLYNLNYGTAATANKVTIEDENVAIEVAIDRLNASQGTIAKAKAVFANMGIDGVFGRSDIAAITKDSVTAAGNLITKLKNADLIEPVSGFGKGKYKFIAPKE